jgi:hypothetical protein
MRTFEDSFEAAASDLLLELEVAAGGRGVDGLGLLLLVLLLLLLQLLFLLLEGHKKSALNNIGK